MRLLFICALAVSSITGFSQSPNSFKYQSVLRDKNGLLIVDKTVSVRISILQSKIDGAAVYSETHSTKTSGSGIINLEIGKGVIVSGLFSSIAWGLNLHFVKIEMDPAGGSAFELVGVSQLLSVPYAMFSQTSGDEKWDNVTGGINYKSGNVGIGTIAPTYSLDVAGSINSSSLLINGQAIRSSPWNLSGNSISYSTGNVGIGILTPTYKLDVAGTLNATTLLMNGQPVGSSPWSLSGNNLSYSAGNVGIGNNSPSASLDVVGAGATNASVITARNNSSTAVSNYSSGDVSFLQAGFLGYRSRGTWQSPTNLLAGDRIGSFGAAGYANGSYSTGAAMEMYTGPSLGGYIVFGTIATPGATRLERMRITETGNIGIGISSPAYNLDVAGTINTNSLLVNGTPLVSSPWNISGSNISYSAGNVGIGTPSPSSNLEIIGSGSSNPYLLTTKNNWSNSISVYSAGDIDYLQASTALFRSRGTNQSPTNLLVGDRIGLFTGNGYANGGYNIQATIQMYAGTNLGSYLTFETTSSPFVPRTERMRIAENGNVIVKTADVYISNIGSGVVMKSPDGSCWRMTVGNTGLPVFTSITCPQ